MNLISFYKTSFLKKELLFFCILLEIRITINKLQYTRKYNKNNVSLEVKQSKLHMNYCFNDGGATSYQLLFVFSEVHKINNVALHEK